MNWCLLEPIQIMKSLSRVMTIFPTIRVKAFLNIYLLNLQLLRTFEDFNHRNQIEKVCLSLFSLLFLSLSSSIFAPIFLFRYLRSTIYLSSSLSLSLSLSLLSLLLISLKTFISRDHKSKYQKARSL